ncbi:hypothetical protein VTO42DRAFT_7024 [Malbranchea cinnamomea]
MRSTEQDEGGSKRQHNAANMEDRPDRGCEGASQLMMDHNDEYVGQWGTEDELQFHQQTYEQRQQQQQSPPTLRSEQAEQHDQTDYHGHTDVTGSFTSDTHEAHAPSSPSPAPRLNPSQPNHNHPIYGHDESHELEPDSLDDSYPYDNSYEYDEEHQHEVPNRTILEEERMHRKLMEMESSFFPEPSTIAVGGAANTGADDSYLVGAHEGDHEQEESELHDEMAHHDAEAEAADAAYQTPAHYRKHTETDQGDEVYLDPNSSALETISSPPTAAAAARTVRKVLSDTFTSTALRRADEREQWTSLSENAADYGDVEATPRRPESQQRELTVSQLGPPGSDVEPTTVTTPSKRKRPKFLSRRQSSYRLSVSSVATAHTDATSSDANMGVDYALQSGGAAPENNSLRPPRQSIRELSRTTSLGSMASGVSGLSDEGLLERRAFSGVSDASLHTLDEEEAPSQTGMRSSQEEATEEKGQLHEDEADARPENDDSNDKDGTPPMTPKANAQENAIFPGDTVTTQRFHDFLPSTSLREQFRGNHFDVASPNKQGPSASVSGHSFSRGRHMTLKEQSSTIDRLSKENFDLKMRIHFLNEALSKRSEEGIQEMVSENVELKSDKLKLQKENQALRKKIRELEKQLKDRQDGEEAGSEREGKDEEGSDGERIAVYEEEILFLRERIESYEAEIERLRSECISRESEKRKLAEMYAALNEGRGGVVGSEAGAREEREMWKDMLDAETVAREQAEEECRRLREELLRVKNDVDSAGPSRGFRHGRMASVLSQSASDRNFDRSSNSSRTLIELDLLRKENSELRRQVSAQTSMLTSRNREKEILYQEIEELKLGQRRSDGRSVTGDSIFERSASRAADRGHLRVSEGTRGFQLSETERENYEIRTGELRDQVSTLKLENQNLRARVEELQNDLRSYEREYLEEMDRVDEELQAMQMERDNAVQIAQEREAELHELKAQAEEELTSLQEDLFVREEECERLQAELKNQEENFKTVQAELRSATEGILRLEEDAQSNLQKYKAVQNELDDANRELESMEKDLFEANTKVQRLTVQLESSQNEIAFLREEQDGDKIRIGDLESELKTTQMSLQSEKERAKELDHRLAEERHQREVVDTKEKQEVQRMMNELNREATSAKDEVRKLKKSLSAREIEVSTWKNRLMELENSLREALGDLNGTRSSLLMSITKLQKELESTTLELESTRNKLDEKEALLRNREALLESHGLETKKLAELLERERQAHRADKHSFEQSLKSHQQASRTIAQNNSRITELENARTQDRKRWSNLEQQYKDQLSERNAMFLTLWKRLSAMCGQDWVHSNSLINGNLPSQEVIGNMLFWPGFSKNLLLAVKRVESLMNNCKSRIKQVERDLTKEYNNLEQNLAARIKKLDRLEESIIQLRANRRPQGPDPYNEEISKLKGENRLLKAELNLLQSHTRARASAPSSAAVHPRSDRIHHHSTSRGGTSGIPRPSGFSPTSPSTPISPTSGTGAGALAPQAPFSPPSHNVRSGEPSQEKWIQRLRELERRLKAEREARLLDRSGARKRLEERDAENEELRAQLEREKMKSRNPHPAASSVSATSLGTDGTQTGSGTPDQPQRRERQRSSDRRGKSEGSRTTGKRTRARSRRRDSERNDGEEESQHLAHQQRRKSRRDEERDAYDNGYDDGSGTGTDEGEGLTIEVEV